MCRTTLTTLLMSAVVTLLSGQVRAQQVRPRTAPTVRSARTARGARTAPAARTPGRVAPTTSRPSISSGRSSLGTQSYFGTGGQRLSQRGSFSNLRTPARRPAVSPYLNLLGGNGRSTAFNYFRSVRPENEFRNSYQQLGRSTQGLQRQITEQQRLIQSQASGLSQSGHRTSFLNLGTYFPQTGR